MLKVFRRNNKASLLICVLIVMNKLPFCPHVRNTIRVDKIIVVDHFLNVLASTVVSGFQRPVGL